MLQMPVLTTEKLTLPASTNSFTLSSPDIFSDATAGDVYLFDLSLEFSTTTTPPDSLLKVTIIESYTQNELSSTMLMNITDEPDKTPYS